MNTLHRSAVIVFLLAAAAFGQTIDVQLGTEQNDQIQTIQIKTDVESKFISVEVIGWDTRGLVNAYQLAGPGLRYIWVPPGPGEYDVTVRGFSPDAGFLPTRTEKVTVGDPPPEPDKPDPDDDPPAPDEFDAGPTSYQNSRQMPASEKKSVANTFREFAESIRTGGASLSDSPDRPADPSPAYTGWREAVQTNLSQNWPLNKTQYAEWCDLVAGGLK